MSSDIRQRITDQIIEGLRRGTPAWRRPWASGDGGLPKSVATGCRYTGANVLALEAARMARGYTSCWWGTYRQWQAVGGQVRRRPGDVPPGEWGVRCIFVRPVTRVRKTADGEEREEEFRVLRTFVVFHLDQVDGDGPTLKRFRTPVEGRTEFDRYEEAERVIAATGAAIHHGGDRAVYHRLTDAITLPPRDRFKSQADYYTTAFHEVAHWTERRLGWDGPYALGELRAEMASCFLATEVGVPQSDDLTNHQAYVASWLRALEGDPSVVFRIASAASAAADHVLGYSRPEPGQPDETILGTAARSDRAE